MEKLRIHNPQCTTSHELSETDSGHLVAIIYGDDIEQTNHRTNIFAAAPELLEACKGLVDFIQNHVLPEHATIRFGLANARKAIAKAEGK